METPRFQLQITDVIENGEKALRLFFRLNPENRGYTELDLRIDYLTAQTMAENILLHCDGRTERRA